MDVDVCIYYYARGIILSGLTVLSTGIVTPRTTDEAKAKGLICSHYQEGVAVVFEFRQNRRLALIDLTTYNLKCYFILFSNST